MRKCESRDSPICDLPVLIEGGGGEGFGVWVYQTP